MVEEALGARPLQLRGHGRRGAARLLRVGRALPLRPRHGARRRAAREHVLLQVLKLLGLSAPEIVRTMLTPCGMHHAFRKPVIKIVYQVELRKFDIF